MPANYCEREDRRTNAVDLILARYLINVKRMSFNDADYVINNPVIRMAFVCLCKDKIYYYNPAYLTRLILLNPLHYSLDCLQSFISIAINTVKFCRLTY